MCLLLSINIESPVLSAKSLDPDQTPRSAASDLGLHCLPMSILWDTRYKWVKTTVNSSPFTEIVGSVVFSPEYQIPSVVFCIVDLFDYVMLSQAFEILSKFPCNFNLIEAFLPCH